MARSTLEISADKLGGSCNGEDPQLDMAFQQLSQLQRFDLQLHWPLMGGKLRLAELPNLGHLELRMHKTRPLDGCTCVWCV